MREIDMSKKGQRIIRKIQRQNEKGDRMRWKKKIP